MTFALASFFAGFLTAFSPCIAPLLPLYVLRGSKPLLMATLIASGTFFILLATLLLLNTIGSILQMLGGGFPLAQLDKLPTISTCFVLYFLGSG